MENASTANPPPEEEEARLELILQDPGQDVPAEVRLAYESDERFRQVVETIDEVFWMTDPGKNVMIYVSPAYERIWGRSREELLESPRAWVQAVHPEDRDRVLRAALAGQVTGEYDEEYRIIRPDGSLRWIRDRAYPVRDENGEVYRITGVARDITEQKKAEEQLEAANARLELLLKQSPAAIYSRRPEYPFQATFMSENFEPLAGYPVSQVLSDPEFWVKRIHPDDLEMVIRKFRSLETHGRLTVEYRYLNADGKYHWRHDEATLVRDIAGYPIEIVGFWIDITERKQTEEALRASEKRFRELIESSSDIITMINSKGEILYESPSVERVLGYAPEELLGLRALDLMHPEDRARVTRAISEGLRGGEVKTVEYRMRRKDGAWRWLESVGRAVPGGDDDEVVGIVTSRDITDHKRAEQERRRLARERERLARRLLVAQEEERRWTALDIHDGPTQQAVAADMYLKTYIAEKQNTESPTLESYLERAATFLGTAIHELRRVISDLRPSLLDDLGLAEAVRGLADRITAGAGPEVRFETNVEGLRLDSLVESSLYRIVQEALNNAIKHSGTPIVEVRLWRNGNRLTATVKDHGTGFDVAQGPGESAGARLGLAGMRERAALIGGKLDIQSGPGGTTVSVKVPLPGTPTREAGR